MGNEGAFARTSPGSTWCCDGLGQRVQLSCASEGVQRSRRKHAACSCGRGAHDPAARGVLRGVWTSDEGAGAQRPSHGDALADSAPPHVPAKTPAAAALGGA